MKIELERPDVKKEGRKDAIIEICNQYFLPHSVLDNLDKRHRPVVERRMMTMLLLRNFAKKLSLTDIGQVFKKDHGTCLHAIKTMRDLIETDIRLQTQYAALRNRIVSEIGTEGKVEDLVEKRKRLEGKRIQREITKRGILSKVIKKLEEFPEAKQKIEKDIEACLNLS